MKAKKAPENFQIDNLDLKILSYLTKDAFKPYTEIARELIISSGTVHVRMGKLEKMGVVKGSHLHVDSKKLGFDICTFIGIFLEKGSLYNDAVKQLRNIPEIVELHYTTGTYTMFAKLICRDTAHLRVVMNEKIQHVKGIQRTETFISLEESINRQIDFEERTEE